VKSTLLLEIIFTRRSTVSFAGIAKRDPDAAYWLPDGKRWEKMGEQKGK
jgi:hypothetical protein